MNYLVWFVFGNLVSIGAVFNSVSELLTASCCELLNALAGNGIFKAVS